MNADTGVDFTFLTFPVGSCGRVVMSDESRFACALTAGGEAVRACPLGDTARPRPPRALYSRPERGGMREA